MIAGRRLELLRDLGPVPAVGDVRDHFDHVLGVARRLVVGQLRVVVAEVVLNHGRRLGVVFGLLLAGPDFGEITDPVDHPGYLDRVQLEAVEGKLRRGPLRREHEQAVSLLRDAEVGGLHDAVADVIAHLVKRVLDGVEELSVGGVLHPADVLEEGGLRIELVHPRNEIHEEVVPVVAPVGANHFREPLTGGAAGDEVDGVAADDLGDILVVDVADVLRQLVRLQTLAIVRERGAGVVIDLDGVDELEAGAFEADGEPSRPREQIDVGQVLLTHLLESAAQPYLIVGTRRTVVETTYLIGTWMICSSVRLSVLQILLTMRRVSSVLNTSDMAVII